jgi:hypothetical protein
MGKVEMKVSKVEKKVGKVEPKVIKSKQDKHLPTLEFIGGTPQDSGTTNGLGGTPQEARTTNEAENSGNSSEK